MIKRLIFVTGFGVGFVVGSASGRKSYEALKQNAVKTWHDPKVQEKVSEGTDWVKSEVPVVGGKLADSAKKAADTVGTKAADASSSVKEKVSGSSAGTESSSGAAATGASTTGTSTTGYADLQDAKPVTPESPLDPAEPHPAPGDTQH
ncbi:hypothetical protein [Kocuria rosea]|jgi:hypothetical protein|uniref:YtxH domain-containing protein n=1 Tax=Kocuria rosea subsp. polaris TaxID=136273 RepID=A0A0A6VUZ3_KOCRO|nr:MULTISPECIES: hypothetical protein [Kocuria]KHD98685.1 hypothetical protein GY22_03215 [Kocuria polaris]MCM3486983.1 hypothetical protein [Kocuria rosea]VEH42855.1 Uncharacterised protein [Kocuria rosea]